MKRLPAWMIVAGLACGAARAEDGKTARQWQEAYTDGEGRFDRDRFLAADRDGNGKLSREEAAAARLTGEEAGGAERFRRADADGDGALTQAECGHYLRQERALRRGIRNHAGAGGPAATTAGATALPSPPAAAPGDPDTDDPDRKDRIERKWRQGYVDPDDPSGYDQGRFERHAGEDGLLSREEARDGSTPLERRAGGEERFDRADRDGDGNLTKKEAKRELDQERKRWKEKGEGKGGKGKGRGGK